MTHDRLGEAEVVFPKSLQFYDVPFDFPMLPIGCGCIQHYLRARANPFTAVILMHDPWKYAVCASFILSALENEKMDSNPISIEIAKVQLIVWSPSFQKLEIPI